MPKHNLPGRDRVLVDLIDSATNVTQALSRALKYGLEFNKTIVESPSEEIVRTISEFNSAAEDLMRQLPRPPIVHMVKEVEKWFKDSSMREQEEFITTEFDNLAVFMHSIGINIINHFNLWAYPWNPKIENGSDVSPYHPENMAMQVIEQVWRNTKNA